MLKTLFMVGERNFRRTKNTRIDRNCFDCLASNIWLIRPQESGMETESNGQRYEINDYLQRCFFRMRNRKEIDGEKVTTSPTNDAIAYNNF